MSTKLPRYIFHNGSIWENGYSNYFGMGYMKLTNNMRKHPKKTFMNGMQVLKMLQAGKCDVAIDPKPQDQIIDNQPYSEWLKTN